MKSSCTGSSWLWLNILIMRMSLWSLMLKRHIINRSSQVSPRHTWNQLLRLPPTLWGGNLYEFFPHPEALVGISVVKPLGFLHTNLAPSNPAHPAAIRLYSLVYLLNCDLLLNGDLLTTTHACPCSGAMHLFTMLLLLKTVLHSLSFTCKYLWPLTTFPKGPLLSEVSTDLLEKSFLVLCDHSTLCLLLY